jgi:hypothetical protein
MESLEGKLDRLSLEQRKEVGDFIDFLLSRSEHLSPIPVDSGSSLPVPVEAPPLLLSPETCRESGTVTEGAPDAARGSTQPIRMPDEAPPEPFHEIGGGIPDSVSHDYMDYGQFERPASPATEAVKKIKRKIVAREGQDKPRHLLDWVD